MRIALTSLFCLATATGQPFETFGKFIAATPEYDLAITLRPAFHRLEVSGTIGLPPRDKPQETIELDLGELMKEFQVEVVEPAASAGPAALTKGEKESPKDPTDHWLLHPKEPIPPNQPV